MARPGARRMSQSQLLAGDAASARAMAVRRPVGRGRRATCREGRHGHGQHEGRRSTRTAEPGARSVIGLPWDLSSRQHRPESELSPCDGVRRHRDAERVVSRRAEVQRSLPEL